MYAREKNGDDSESSRHKEFRAWVGLLEEYNLRAGSSGKEAGEFSIGKQCD
jgi:hypothetical protein